MAKTPNVEIEIDSFISSLGHRPETRVEPRQMVKDFLDRIIHSDEVGLDVFGIGEYRRQGLTDRASVVILAEAFA